ncbi:hypothetical protein HZB05_01310 [Candidatus Wolfebacteria bacterium]|nr:hypothetical protein [Candidatus Wolfebacteria bacterium]
MATELVQAAEERSSQKFQPFQVFVKPNDINGYRDQRIRTLGGKLVTVTGAFKTKSGLVAYKVAAAFGTARILVAHTNPAYNSPPQFNLSQLPLESLEAV